MAQRLIHQDQGHHRLADRGGAQADAGVVAAGGDDVYFATLDIHGTAGQAQSQSF